MRLRTSFFAGNALAATLLVLFGALFVRLTTLQIRDGDTLLARARDQQRATVPLPARRGLIVDARGRILAGTALRESVFADPKLIPDKHEAARLVAGVLDVPAGELGQDLVAAGQRRFFVIARGVDETQAAAIKSARHRGIGVFDEPYRTYPLGSVAAQVLGFVSADGAGLSGLELQCDEWLRGDAGTKTIVRDAARRAFWLAEDGFQPPRDGYHLVLSLDAVIQAAAERALEKAIAQFKAESGIAIVMDPASGAVLAMANAPGFDPNHYQDYAGDASWRFRNRALTDPAEPGSIFKPFIAAKALEAGVVRSGELFDCERGLWRDGARLLHDHHPYTILSFEDVLIKSSNIGVGKIGKRLGAAGQREALRAFGFDGRTGIDLAGEDGGIVPGADAWTSFTTTSVPMGQELAVTPIQVCRAFCAFANGGTLVQPHLLRAVLGSDGQVVQEFAPPPGKRVMKAAVADRMRRDILAAVVSTGTGTKAGLSQYQVFGKTGTAQIPKIGGRGYVPDAYLSSFVGGAPLNDPRLVVLVSIRRPKKSLGYYGGTVAAPAAGEILAESLAYLEVPPERPAAAPQVHVAASD